jgi:outer membrane protein insertion porin family
MRQPVFLFLAALAVAAAVRPAAAQKFQPKAILFQGDPEYSSDELLAAAGLKKGVVLSYTDMQDYSKRLLGSGVFASVAFKFDGQDLTFLLAPSTDLYAIQLENLPLTPGADLDAKLHAQIPLYHGKVPADGGINEDVRTDLEKMLTAEGLQASVVATTAADLNTHQINAVSYSITSPPVQIGFAHIDGVSDPFQTKVRAILDRAAKNPFSTTDSANNIERVVEQFYGDQGYAAAKVQATRSGDPTFTPGSIVVPFAVQVQEGRVYKVGSIQVPPGDPVTQAEIDKALAPSAGGAPVGVRVRSIWVLIAERCHNAGHLDCKVTPQPVFNDADATVNYTVDVDPGPVYHLGFVKFDNVSDELRKLLIHNWEMMPGDVFDESYVASFITKVQQQDPVLRQSLLGVKVKFDANANPDTHDVNVVIRLEK